MRRIPGGPIMFFSTLYVLIFAMAIATTWLLFRSLALGDFRGFALFVSTMAFVYVYGFLVYRLFLQIMPLREGDQAPGSRDEFVANVNILFYLLLFNTLVRTNFVPVPLMRLVYLALGARLGKNTYCAGAILDPPLTTIGDNCLIGHNAALFSHAIEGNHFSLDEIQIGNGVTIGANAVVMSAVKIGDGAIVSAGSVVLKGTQILAGEIWGGVPARKIRARKAFAPEMEQVRENVVISEPVLS